MQEKVCSICGQTKPEDTDHYRYRTQGDKSYFTAECLECIAKAKVISQARVAEREQKQLEDIEKAGVDVFLKSYSQGGTSIPHTAELVEHVMRYFGGVGGFSAVLVKQYWDAPAGGSARNRLLETMARLVTKNVESGGAKKPLQLWSEDELEAELEQRMADAVATYTGVTIDAKKEEPVRIGVQEDSTPDYEEEDASEGIPADIADQIKRADRVSERLLQRNPKRASRKKT